VALAEESKVTILGESLREKSHIGQVLIGKKLSRSDQASKGKATVL